MSPFLKPRPRVNGRVPVTPEVNWNAVTHPPEAATVNVKVVVRVKAPAVPVTVIVDVPVGVDADVESVKVEVQFGVHDVGANEAVTAGGRPEAERETDCGVPETVLSVMVFAAFWPTVTR